MVFVRSERPGDIPEISAIHSESFPGDVEARLVSELRQAGHLSVSLVAETNGRLVGHVAFSPVSAANGAVGVGLGPVAVRESHRRQGVAAQLIETGLTACRAAGFGWAVVLGAPRYYSRFGFQTASKFGLCDEYSGGLAFQVMELIAGELPAGLGLVRYAPEFSALS